MDNTLTSIPGEILVRGELGNVCPLSGLLTQCAKAAAVTVLTPLQHRMISGILCKQNVFVAAPKNSSGRTLGFLLPILAQTMEPEQTSIFKEAKSSPAVIIVCASTQRGIQLVTKFRNILDKLASSGHKSSGLRVFFMDDPRDGETVNEMRKHLDILIITVGVLIRMLIKHPDKYCLKFRLSYTRLRYVVFEEVGMTDKYFAEDIMDFMKTIGVLQADNHSAPESLPNLKVICCGSGWNSGIEAVYQALIRAPRKIVLILGSSFQVLQYAKPTWYIHAVSERSQLKLKQLVDISFSAMAKNVTQVIACSTLEVADRVRRYLNDSIELKHYLQEHDKNHMNQGTFEKSSCLPIIHVVSDATLDIFQTIDASCVIHFDLGGNKLTNSEEPFHPKRISCLWDRVAKKGTEIHVLVEPYQSNLLALQDFLLSMDVELPLKIQNFANELRKREAFRLAPCPSWNVFGFCSKAGIGCYYRHDFCPDDFSQVPDAPSSGEVEFLVVESISPSIYLGQLRRHFQFNNDERICLKSYSAEMSVRESKLKQFYSTSRRRTTPAQISLREVYCAPSLGLKSCVPQRPGSEYVRVKITKVLHSHSGTGIPEIAEVFCLDSGIKAAAALNDLLPLPNEFNNWPAHCVQIILSNLLPPEGVCEYPFKSLEAARHLTEGKVWQGKILLALGNSVWINPMVQYNIDPVTTKTVQGKNVRTELVRRNHVDVNDNHQHMTYILERIRFVQPDFSDIIYEMNAGNSDSNLGGFEFYKFGDPMSWTELPLSSVEPEVKIASIPLTISSFTNPWEIFGVSIHSNGPHGISPVVQLETKMTEEINHHLLHQLKNVEHCMEALQIGGLVALQSDAVNRWQRGMILSVFVSDDEDWTKFSVFLVDHGTTVHVRTPLEGMVPILKKYVDMLPFQTVCLKFAHIQPLGIRGGGWNTQDNEAFAEIIARSRSQLDWSNHVNVIATAKVRNSDLPCHFYEALAFTPSTVEEEEELGMQLVRQNQARTTPTLENVAKLIKNAYIGPFKSHLRVSAEVHNHANMLEENKDLFDDEDSDTDMWQRFREDNIQDTLAEPGPCYKEMEYLSQIKPRTPPNYFPDIGEGEPNPTMSTFEEVEDEEFFDACSYLPEDESEEIHPSILQQLQLWLREFI